MFTKGIRRRIRRKAADWEKIFAKAMNSYPKYAKNSSKSTIRKLITQLKNK